MRIRDNVPVPPRAGNLGTGLVLTSFENALIEGNVIDVPNPIALQQVASQAITAFNNRTAGGTLLRLCKDTTGVLKVDSLESAVADALALSLL